MDTSQAFALYDCNLARCATGRTCSNLRELLDAIKGASDAALEHHMMRCALDDHFELYEFPNDLARWCWDALGDDVLAEELGLIDPYQHASIALLRETLVNVIEERLWGSERLASCRPGRELHFIESSLIAYDTGERLPTPTALAEALPKMPARSLFYHVHEARRRTGGRTDDFSDWLERYGAEAALVARVRAVDFYFLNLKQLRSEFIEAFRSQLVEADAVVPLPS